MELDNLSGAYIRSLVKQLTTSSSAATKDDDAIASSAPNLTKIGKILDAHHHHHQPKQQPTQQHKKQVRRRLHTSRPYQERLLNMAEARREIVTALKFHRASMKQQANEQKTTQQDSSSVISLKPLPLQHPSLEQDEIFKSRRNPTTYPSYSSFSHPLPNTYNYTCSPASTSSSSITPSSLLPENTNFMLPNQTLGLNLNFHDFNNLDDSTTTLYSSPSSSSSSPPPLSIQETPLPAISQKEGNPAGLDLHTAMDDEGMAEIRSLGEQYQMEWNDTMNLVTSAWWFKFFKNMEEHGGTDVKSTTTEDNDAYHSFEEIMEFPAWMNNANESCLEQYCSQHYCFQDPTLPCMEIGDIEGMDEEWLA